MWLMFPIGLYFSDKISQVEINTPVRRRLTVNKKIVTGTPTNIKIPKINIDTNIYSVGINSSGEMDIKDDLDNVAWYQYGPKPGETGSAVIAGHYGWNRDGKAAVFINLHNLEIGDDIYVIDDKGNEMNFEVSNIKQFDPSANASSVFLSNDKKSHLNLVTCNGTWENSKQTYSNRLVVFADKK